MAASGTYAFAPDVASLLVEAYARIQIRGPALTVEHIVEGRRSANLILSDWANRGVSLWVVGDRQLTIPLVPNIPAYPCPLETVDILDAYVRTYTPSSTTTTLGNTLAPMVTAAGVPVLGTLGDPALMSPASGVFSSVAGSQEITITWPAHGLVAGSPVFLTGVISIGDIVLSGFLVVDSVVDSNNVTVLAPSPAVSTQASGGAPPLFATTSGSSSVQVIVPNHGQVVGGTFPVPISTTVGGVTLSGDYAVTQVDTAYQFEIDGGTNATSTTAAFQNGGQFQLATQEAGTMWTDVFLWPLSRDEYAMLPDKQQAGRPAQFWFNRTSVPSVNVWPLANTVNTYAFIAYRMRRVQDANPLGGQTLDMPSRFWQPFVAELAAAVAEKFAPEQFAQKLARAEMLWERAFAADSERVSTYITPDVAGAYY